MVAPTVVAHPPGAASPPAVSGLSGFAAVCRATPQGEAIAADEPPMTSSSGISPRRVRFEYPTDTPTVWTPARPEFSCAANSVSLMMPALEPYFVRSIRAALPDLDGPLREQTEAYIHQESQHHRQHRRFNQVLLGAYPALATLERGIASAFRRLEQRRSRQFNLAFAAASETMAYAAARWAEKHRKELFTGADDVASTLFLWHLAEEVEHKSVAHDVYWQLHASTPGARRRYGAAMAVSLTLIVSFVIGGTALLLAMERRLHSPVAWFRLLRWSVGFAFELLSDLVLSLLPGFHPNDFADPLWYEVWLQEFDAASGTLPVWHRAENSKPQPDTARDDLDRQLG